VVFAEMDDGIILVLVSLLEFVSIAKTPVSFNLSKCGQLVKSSVCKVFNARSIRSIRF